MDANKSILGRPRGIRFRPENWDKLTRIAESQDRSRAWVLNKMIEQHEESDND